MKKLLGCLILLSFSMAVLVSIEAGKTKGKKRQLKKGRAKMTKEEKARNMLAKKLKKFDSYLDAEITAAVRNAGENPPARLTSSLLLSYYTFNGILSYLFLFDWLAKTFTSYSECGYVEESVLRDIDRFFPHICEYQMDQLIFSTWTTEGSSQNSQGEGHQMVDLYRTVCPLLDQEMHEMNEGTMLGCQEVLRMLKAYEVIRSDADEHDPEHAGFLAFLGRVITNAPVDDFFKQLIGIPLKLGKDCCGPRPASLYESSRIFYDTFKFYRDHYAELVHIYSHFYRKYSALSRKYEALLAALNLAQPLLFLKEKTHLDQVLAHVPFKKFSESLEMYHYPREEMNFGKQMSDLYTTCWNEIRRSRSLRLANIKLKRAAAETLHKTTLLRRTMQNWKAFVLKEKVSRAPVENRSSITLRDELNGVIISTLKIAQHEKFVDKAVSHRLNQGSLANIHFASRVTQWKENDIDGVLEAEGYLDTENQKYFANYDLHLNDEEKKQRIAVRHSLPFELTRYLFDYGFIGDAQDEGCILINVPMRIEFDNSDHHESGFLQVALKQKSDGDGWECYHWFFKPGARNELLRTILSEGLDSMRWNQLVYEVGIEQAILHNMFAC